jgi:hypothetical protein
MNDVTVHTSGPIFDGRAASIMDRYLTETRQAIAEQGANLIQQRLSAVIQHNVTGQAVSNVATSNQLNDTVITDDVIYGPWLEGVGSRNLSTRFKGYHAFRQSTQILQEDAEVIAQAKMVPTVAELNGGD